MFSPSSASASPGDTGESSAYSSGLSEAAAGSSAVSPRAAAAILRELQEAEAGAEEGALNAAIAVLAVGRDGRYAERALAAQRRGAKAVVFVHATGIPSSLPGIACMFTYRYCCCYRCCCGGRG